MNDRAVAARAAHAETLIQRFDQRTANLLVVGLGYVGLPLACRFAEAGFSVFGLDIDRRKIEALRAGASYLSTVPPARIGAALSQRFVPHTDYACAADADAVFMCVPTPLTASREPDLQYITGTTDALLPHLHEGQLLSLESTTYPGTTEEVLRPRVEARACAWAKISSWCSRPSARTRATSVSTRAASRRSAADRRPPASRLALHFTAKRQIR
jgi:UDP-N-acetyl-D-glucosamine dehydrogenase